MSASAANSEPPVFEAPRRFVPFPFSYHQEVELTIDALTALGMGVGRVQLDASLLAQQAELQVPLEAEGSGKKKSGRRRRGRDKRKAPKSADAEWASYGEGGATGGGESDGEEETQTQGGPSRGWAVIVPFCLPGEVVRVRVFKNEKRHSQADLLEVVEPSATRVAPTCELFGACGGCQYQHLEYETQLGWKTKQVRELLERIGRLSSLELSKLVLPAIGSPRQMGYRTKLTPHYEAMVPARAEDDFKIGFFRHDSDRRMVDVPQCPIATPLINQALPKIRADAQRDAAARAESHAAAVAAEAHAAGGRRRRPKGATLLIRHADEGVVTAYDAEVSETVGELKLRFKAGDFFQNNPFTLPLMVEHVLSNARGVGEGTAQDVEYLIDAYCGSGLFALSAARHFKQVLGVETSASSVSFAERNALSNSITNTRFLAGSAEAIFATIPSHVAGAKSSVVIDPPRKGCDRSFLSQLIQFAPRRIVYVSCRAQTLARDLGVLVASGYQLRHVQPFDMFPQTRHIESVATLEWPRAGDPAPTLPEYLTDAPGTLKGL